MKDAPIYRYRVCPKGGQMRFFTEDQWEIAKEYAKKHDTWVRLI